MAISYYKKVLILLCGLIEILIFSGIIFGWPALFYMLKSEGVFEDLCQPISSRNSSGLSPNISTSVQNSTQTNSTNAPDNITGRIDQESRDCGAQDNLLNLAYTIGVFSMGFTSFIWGFLLETWGLRIVRLALNALISSGCILLCFTNRERSFLIIPAVILLGLAGVPLRIADMQIADYFPAKRSTVITVFSGAFSASPIVFVVLKYVYDSGVPFMVCLSVLVVLSLLMLPITYALLPPISVKNDIDSHSNNGQNKSSDKNSLTTKNSIQIIKSTNGVKDKNHTNGFHDNENDRKNEEEMEVFIRDVNKNVPKVSIITTDEFPLSVSLFSVAFTLHQLWFSWLNTYMVLYSGSMSVWLKRVTTDTSIAGGFTEAFGIVQVSALIIAPLAGLFMDHSVRQANKVIDPFEQRVSRAQSGFYPILVTTVALATAVICRFFNTAAAVYSSIVFITLLRSFLVAVASAYLRIRFHANHFNRLNGIMCTTGAVFSLLQFPLFVWESQPVNAFWVNMFCLIATVFCFSNPIYLIITPIQKYLINKEEVKENKSKLFNKDPICIEKSM